MSLDSNQYEYVCRVASDLCGPETLVEGLANEYVRGQCNLIADLPGVFGQDTGERMEDVLRNLRSIAFVSQFNN